MPHKDPDTVRILSNVNKIRIDDNAKDGGLEEV